MFHFYSILISFLLVTPSLYAGDFLLGENLSREVAIEKKWIEFLQAPGTMRAPIASGIFVNSTAISLRDEETLTQLFVEKFYVSIPDNLPIEILISEDRSEDGIENEFWKYPSAFLVAHWIGFRTEKNEPFELRTIQKLADGRWDFALYSFNTEKNIFTRENYEGMKPAKFEMKLQRQDRFPGESQIELKRINLGSCQHCHFINSPSRHQYSSRDQAGPCGFAPHHLELKKTWADSFYQEKGFRPFK